VDAVIAVLYLLLAVLVGLCGRRRRMGFVGFFIVSLLLTPVLGLLLVYMTQERSPEARPARRW
jgi:hypothetical protein